MSRGGLRGHHAAASVFAENRPRNAEKAIYKLAHPLLESGHHRGADLLGADGVRYVHPPLFFKRLAHHLIGFGAVS